MAIRKLSLLTWIIIVTGWIVASVSALCDDVASVLDNGRASPTWDDFVALLDGYQYNPSGMGLGVLCPFVIRGDACPSYNKNSNDGGGYVVTTDLYLICDSSYDYATASKQGGCIIDCPTTHFQVASSSGTLTLEGFALRGSERTSIIVQSGASLTTYSSTFERNWNPMDVGGVVRGYEGSVLDLQLSSFVNNGARFGGVIHSQGAVTMRHGTFRNNTAAQGAVVFGSGGQCRCQ
jgi:hypothetical protein